MSWTHGRSGYQNNGCRCRVCYAAWSAVYLPAKRAAYAAKKALVSPPPVETLTSWWTTAPRVGLTKFIEREHLVRMAASTLGKGRSRLIGTEELER